MQNPDSTPHARFSAFPLEFLGIVEMLRLRDLQGVSQCGHSKVDIYSAVTKSCDVYGTGYGKYRTM